MHFSTTNKKKTLSGFKLTFAASQDACGGTLEAASGVIQSPGYPVMDHNDRNCEWIIKVPKGRRIKLEILDYDLDKTVNFIDHGVAVFNSDDLKYNMVHLKPSQTPPKYLESTDNVLVVYFWSDHKSGHRGFKAKFTSDEPTGIFFNLPFVYLKKLFIIFLFYSLLRRF